jgi:Uma2 family endonuclease
MRVLNRNKEQDLLTQRLYTAEELEQLPNEERYELIRGELCLMPNNSAEHGYITAQLSGRLIVYVEDNDLGYCFAAETRFVIELKPDTTMGPDFAFVAKDRIAAIPRKGYLRLAPDLVVETRSPGDAQAEFGLKIARWLQAGVRIVWALDPSTQTLTVHRTGVMPQILTKQDTVSGEEVLPGFAYPLGRLFRETAQEIR